MKFGNVSILVTFFNPDRRPTTPPLKSPNAEDIEALAERALADIPQELNEVTGDIVFRVQDFPDNKTVAALELDAPFELLGHYQGVDLTQKSIADSLAEQDMIFLYRRPLMDYWCETGASLDGLVRHVLIHEIGHHFGFSDADMQALEASSE